MRKETYDKDLFFLINYYNSEFHFESKCNTFLVMENVYAYFSRLEMEFDF